MWQSVQRLYFGVLLSDRINPFPGGPPHSTFGFLLPLATANYLHERRHQRELRLESAQKATGMAVSGQADLERTLIFTLPTAFIQTPQQKAVLDLGVLDRNLRTAKVRIEVRNPGIMRPGMFATATSYSKKSEKYAAVAATAILHLHDRDWVYVPAGSKAFRRAEARSGEMLSGNMQVVLSGVAPGQQVVANTLEFQNLVEQ